jgi:tetratricopeptide (TPR) repeat protein
VRCEIVGPLPQDPEAEAKRNAEEANRKRCQVTKATDGGGDKLEQANAKFKLANDLIQQGAYEEALALYQEALEEAKEALACTRRQTSSTLWRRCRWEPSRRS